MNSRQWLRYELVETPCPLTCVLREANGERRPEDLLLEQVLLVEEEDDGGVSEPLVVADGVEELEALLHAVRRLVLVQHLVVLAHRHAEDDRRHVLEAVDPLLTLRPLSSHVEEPGKKKRRLNPDPYLCEAGHGMVTLSRWLQSG